jgi:hypothetical protein
MSSGLHRYHPEEKRWGPMVQDLDTGLHRYDPRLRPVFPTGGVPETSGG